ncbi:hypothetical protein [Acinetobacter ursingii]|uniref:hypothetical protein n=1 Tax=Acinetobacter ursingii TaxID=108980 RepID=UPI00124F8BF1|nr:hypothetical protein [Acinetobacter ursingii]
MVDLEQLKAEIEQFKTEAMKMHFVQVWAESYKNSDPFGYVITEATGVFWIKEQARQLWQFWKFAKGQNAEIAALKAENIELQKKYQHADTQLSDIDGHYTLLKKEVEALKAKLEKVESGEFVVVPKSEIGNYYFDDSECIYIDEPDSFLSELDVGEVCEVKRRDYFDLPTQYAAKVFIDIDNIEWRLFESKLEAEIAANECKDKFWGEQGDGDE